MYIENARCIYLYLVNECSIRVYFNMLHLKFYALENLSITASKYCCPAE